METNTMANTSTRDSIDCIVEINGTHVVLIKRGHGPYNGYWALPGGRQEPGEDLEQTVIRETREETSIHIEPHSDDLPMRVIALGQKTYLDQFRTYSSGKDERGGNTTVYSLRLRGDPNEIAKYLQAGDDAVDIGVFPMNDLPELAFDQAQFIESYRKSQKYKNPIPTTDTIIEYSNGKKEGIILIERKNPPYGLAIPGGFAEQGISYQENAVKEAKEETNLDVVIENPEEPLCVMSDPERDPRGPMTSTVYIAKGYGDLRAGDDAKKARLYSIPEVKQLIQDNSLVFDHAQILQKYLQQRGDMP